MGQWPRRRPTCSSSARRSIGSGFVVRLARPGRARSRRGRRRPLRRSAVRGDPLCWPTSAGASGTRCGTKCAASVGDELGHRWKRSPGEPGIKGTAALGRRRGHGSGLLGDHLSISPAGGPRNHGLQLGRPAWEDRTAWAKWSGKDNALVACRRCVARPDGDCGCGPTSGESAARSRDIPARGWLDASAGPRCPGSHGPGTGRVRGLAQRSLASAGVGACSGGGPPSGPQRTRRPSIDAVVRG